MAREVKPAELYSLYMKGWRHGASAGFMDPILANHDNGEIRRAYDDGYQAGRLARERTAEVASKTYGHVLRTQD